MLFLAIIILLTSLAIASVAAYFSVIGLSMLFVGSGISIIVMGIALEVGKLITVTVLKQLWEKLGFLLKTYLLIASIALSAITSIGVYGYLSNGYNATSIKINTLTENRQLIESRISSLKEENEKLVNYKPQTKVSDDTSKNKSDFVAQKINLITQNESKIKELFSSIEKDKRSVLDQQQTAKNILDEQVNRELAQIPTFNNRLQILDKEVQTWLDQGTGGLFRQNGLEKARQVKESQQKERDAIDQQIKQIQNNVEVLRQNYTKAINEVELKVSTQIKQTEANIQKIEQQILNDKQQISDFQNKTDTIIVEENLKIEEKVKENKSQIKLNDEEIVKLNDKIKEINDQINSTDVGTFKFIAKNFNLELDKTVNWFIIAIISVFDPLAVMLLLCFNQILRLRKNKPVEITPPVITPQPITTISQPLTTTPPLSTAVEDDDWYQHILPNNKVEFKDYPQK